MTNCYFQIKSKLNPNKIQKEAKLTYLKKLSGEYKEGQTGVK